VSGGRIRNLGEVSKTSHFLLFLSSEGWFLQQISLFELLASALLPVLVETDATDVQPVGLPQTCTDKPGDDYRRRRDKQRSEREGCANHED
jgi:hypothetical protein